VLTTTWPFKTVKLLIFGYNYDKQFRLRIAQNPIRSWSQIDGNLWLRFIARGALGGQLSQQPQIEYGFCYHQQVV
jgi:hypothetical protein